MSAGKLVVELVLNDGQYQAKMQRASKDAKALGDSFATLDNRLKGVEKGLSGTLPHLRDIAIVSASLHSILSSLNDTAGAFFKTLLDGNSRLEKTSVLLQGLSKSADTEGKMADAARDVKFLIDTAKSAPFAMNEINNAFVKMRAVGLSDVEGKVKSLTNAIANFGGDNQDLHRATVAIQQMASKGVISMEELRQQLGEAVPNAMQLMADGMGMSMSSFIKAVSEGKIKAIPAINAMMQEMEFTVAGSASRMMETWSGMISQLETNWMLLQKTVGDAGFFDSAKDELKALNSFLTGDDARKYAQTLGDALTSAIKGFESLRETIQKNSEAIIAGADALMKFWLVTKTLSMAKNLLGGAGGHLGSLKDEHNRFKDALSGAGKTTKIEKEIIPMNWGDRTNMQRTVQGRDASGRFTKGDDMLAGVVANTTVSRGAISTKEIVKEVEIATSAWKKYGQIAAASLGMVTGPIGMTVIAVAALASQFIEFGNKAKESLQGVIDKQKELNQRGNRVEGDQAIQTFDDLKSAKTNLEELTKTKDEIEKKLAKAKGDSKLFGGSDTSPLVKKLTRDLATIQDDIENTEKAITEGGAALFDRQLEREKQALKKSIDDKLALRSTEYIKAKGLINKTVDAMEVEKKKTDEINAYKTEAMITLQKKEVEDQLKTLEEIKNNSIKTIDEIKEKGGNIKLFFDLYEQEKGAKEKRDELLSDIGSIKAQIKLASDEASKSELFKKLLGKETELKSVEEKLLKLKELMLDVKKSGIDENDIFKLADGTSTIDAVAEKIKNLLGLRDKLDSGKLIPENAINVGDTEKEENKALKRAARVDEQETARLAAAASNYLKTFGGEYEKVVIKSGGEVTADLIEKLKQKVGELGGPNVNTPGGDVNSVRTLLEKRPGGTEDATVESYNDHAAASALTLKQLEALTEAEDAYKKQSDSTAKSVQELARVQKEFATGKPQDVEKSERTIRLEREVLELKEASAARSTKLQELEKSKEEDANAARIKNIKEMIRIKENANKHEEELVLEREKFETHEMTKAMKSLDEARRLSIQDSVEMERRATNDYVNEFKERAKERGHYEGEALDNLSKKIRENYEEEKRLRSEYESKKANKELQRTISIDVIDRGSGTAYEKDLAKLNQQHDFALQDAANPQIYKTQAESIAAINREVEKYNNDVENLKVSHRDAFTSMMHDTVDFKQVWGDAAATFTNGMLDGVAKLATEGTANFKQFTASVLKGISEMLIKMALLKAVQSVFGSVAFAEGGIAGLPNGTNVSSNSNFVGPVKPYEFGGIAGVSKFASGGSLSVAKASRAEMDAGGVKRTPHIALFAEAGIPEAFIPMLDGQNIPLSVMRDESGNLSAKALLPGGRSIPAKIEQSNVEQFANGGIMGRTTPSASTPKSSASVVLSLPDFVSNFTDSLNRATIKINNLFSAESFSSGHLAESSNVGSAKSGDDIHITIPITNVGGEGKNATDSSQLQKDKGDAWNKMGERIKSIVVKEIVDQKRPGGLLSGR